jgi:anhydro-N-acetylmuramic acid kinase
MDSKRNYRVLGLMSGTSLDGLDLACCSFRENKNGWQYEIVKATTIKYSAAWRHNLSTAHLLNGFDLMAIDAAYGRFLGEMCNRFISQNNLKVDFIASHGHTIFHQPAKGFTFQLGNGSSLYSATGLPVVYDFRTLDVTLGGEGAPLVPVGDKLLFTMYDVCLNLGGIANLSTDVKKRRIAYDICFMNMGLNFLAQKAAKTFDAGGKMASDGEINPGMLKALDKVYNRLKGKRPSLGREIFEQQIQSILDNKKISLNDRLRTFTESSAKEIAEAIISKRGNPSVLCTGGGALNSFFISRLLDLCADNANLIVPDTSVINFKEALVFAFLGMRRVRNETNCLKSVTGASRDSSSGLLIGF